MKVYISLDIEGVTGVTGWDETELKDPMHKDAAAQMKMRRSPHAGERWMRGQRRSMYMIRMTAE